MARVAGVGSTSSSSRGKATRSVSVPGSVVNSAGPAGGRTGGLSVSAGGAELNSVRVSAGGAGLSVCTGASSQT